MFADLVLAVNVGVILAALLFAKRMAGTVKVECQRRRIAESELAVAARAFAAGVTVYSIDGPFSSVRRNLRTHAEIDRCQRQGGDCPSRPRAVH